MAMSLGADVAGQFDMIHAEPVDRRTGKADAVIYTYTGGIFVNGKAKRFYDEDSRKLLGLDPTDRVTVEPFYTVGRDISVEPTTGTMVDLRENIKIFFAADEQQAGTMVANNDTEDRSIFAADMRWSDDTRAERLDEVRPVIRTIRALMVVGWAGKAIGVGLLLCAAYMYMRRHREG